MAFNEQELNIIKFGKESGKSRAEVESALANYRRGTVPKKVTPVKTGVSEFAEDIKQTGSNLKTTFQDTQTKQAQAIESGVRGEQGLGRSFAQAIGIGAGGLSKAIEDVFTGGVKAVLPQAGEESVKSAVEAVAKPIMESSAVQSVIEKYNSLDEERKRDIDAVLGIGSLVTEFAGVGAGTRVASNLTRKAIKTGSEIIDNVSDVVRSGRTFVGQGQNVKNSLIEFISPEADDITKTILKESKPEDIDRFVRIQELATKDPRAITPYESIGDSMSEAAKQLQGKLKTIGEAKSEFLKPLNMGLDPFDSQSIVDDLIRLKNTNPSDVALVDDLLTKARAVKTKSGADKFIDQVQDALYTGNRNLTLPTGSALDKQLKGIVGKFNNELKKSLPKEYAELNTQYSNLKNSTDILNSALGEVIDGVSTRGGSLVKQFFSPNGRKAKELFDFIKQETGIDLAKDTTLARYVMELFDDPRARTLLGGEIPTSVSGVVNRLVDFTVEKTGVGKGLQEIQRKGAIEKAKKLTNPK